jgi:hypothetical protein
MAVIAAEISEERGGGDPCQVGGTQFHGHLREPAAAVDGGGKSRVQDELDAGVVTHGADAARFHAKRCEPFGRSGAQCRSRDAEDSREIAVAQACRAGDRGQHEPVVRKAERECLRGGLDVEPGQVQVSLGTDRGMVVQPVGDTGAVEDGNSHRDASLVHATILQWFAQPHTGMNGRGVLSGRTDIGSLTAVQSWSKGSLAKAPANSG